MSSVAPTAPIAQNPLARQAELVDWVTRFTPSDGMHPTAVPALHLLRASHPSQKLPTVYEPGLLVVVQGSKQASLAGEVFHYDPLHCLLISVTLPMIGQIVDASPGKPYLCVRIALDPQQVGELMLGEDATSAPPADAGRGLHIAQVSGALLDAVLRLLRVLPSPRDAAVLGPLIVREIHYRVLMGDLGGRLREMVMADSHAQRIARAIDLIKRRYAEPVRIEEVARAAHMSESSLHHHFKQVTAMSPMQFQKHLRLHQARRLMLGEGMDAASAGHRVGYESPSQFSREYRRLFGAPPKAEIDQMRAATAPVSNSGPIQAWNRPPTASTNA